MLVHNITSLKQTEDELKESNKKLRIEIENREKLIDDLDAFAHTVAHDLKNSLGSIVSSSELIEEIVKNGDPNFLNDLAGLIKTSANKSMQITQELLILATVSHQKIVKTELEMDSIFMEARKQLQELIEERNVKIITPDNWLISKGYSPWIENVWTNYLSNAIKYGGTHPVIEVGSDYAENNMVKFWIKDNGQGLTKKQQSLIFKKYTRLEPDKAEGYGLGLSIIKRIIKKLGGTVGVDSLGETDSGSTFFFMLPAK